MKLKVVKELFEMVALGMCDADVITQVWTGRFDELFGTDCKVCELASLIIDLCEVAK